MDNLNDKLLNEAQSQTSFLGAVICRLFSPTLIKPLDFDGEPFYYKINGMYGYLMPSGKKVLWFYSDADGSLFYDELIGWSVLNVI